MPVYTRPAVGLGQSVSRLYSFPTVPGNISLGFQLGVTQAALPFHDQYPRCQQYITGLNLQVQVLDSDGNPLDISSATQIKYKIGLPDGTSIDRLGSFVTSGVDGNVNYVTLFGDLAEPGLCTIQIEVVMPTGIFPTSKGYFWVLGNVDNN